MAATVTIPAPRPLRERRQWVLWRHEERDGKPTKVPRIAATPWREASTTDPATWATFERAQEKRHEADGIGFVFTTDDPYTGIDLDDCITDDGEIEPWAAEIVDQLDSYTERTPSGRGLHIIVEAKLTSSRRRIGKFEVYDRGRYFTVTGDRIGEREIEERQDELDAVVARMLPEREQLPPTPVRGTGLGTDDDHELLDRAFRAKNGAEVEALYRGELNGHPSPSEAVASLLWRLAYWTGPDEARLDRIFRSSGLPTSGTHRVATRRGARARSRRRSPTARSSTSRPLRRPRSPLSGLRTAATTPRPRGTSASFLGCPASSSPSWARASWARARRRAPTSI